MVVNLAGALYSEKHISEELITTKINVCICNSNVFGCKYMIHSFLKNYMPNILIQIWHVSLEGTFNRCDPVVYLVTKYYFTMVQPCGTG